VNDIRVLQKNLLPLNVWCNVGCISLGRYRMVTAAAMQLLLCHGFDQLHMWVGYPLACLHRL